MKCNIAKDLLTNYIDGLCSEETNEEMEAHLDDCADCRNVYEKMSVFIPQELPPEDKNIDFLKQLKARIRRRSIIVAVSTSILLLVGFFVFAKNYDIPLPFDPNRMYIEQFKAAAIVREDGRMSWQDAEKAISRGIITEDYENVMDLVRISYRGINNIGRCSRGRTINRNGEEVRVVYYCYTKTLWDSMFVDSDLQEHSEGGGNYGSDIYGDSLNSMDYEPQMREIYYLPIRNLYKIDDLSDEEYDNLREKGDLIWSGVI